MEPIEFIKKITSEIVESNSEIYKELFETTNSNEVEDNYWKEALNFYKKSNVDDKNTILKIIKQIQIDTISNLLGIMDGVVALENTDGDFSLNYEGIPLNGDLQDIFLKETE